MTDKLMAEDRVHLAVLAAELGLHRKTVIRWADIGYGGRRLEHYRIGRKRFSTRQAVSRFLAAMNGERCEAAIGSAEQDPGSTGMLRVSEHAG